MALIHPVMVASTLLVRTENVQGTGFMVVRPDKYNYENPAGHDWEKSVEDRWRLWIVTCAHVTQAETVTVETNRSGRGGQKINWTIEPDQWTKHPEWVQDNDNKNYDVAVTPAPTQKENWSEVEPAYWPAHWHLSRTGMEKSGIVEGDELYMIGFPLGFGDGKRNEPIVRQGILAQCQAYLRGESEIILIDGATWFGNSGGPVVTKPAAIALDGTQRYIKSSLLGMISGTAQWKGIPAGVGIVIPAQTINRTIDIAIDRCVLEPS